MRILIAPDKFKDSLGAKEVAENMALGLREVLPDAELTLLPVSDGGEGFAEVICNAAQGEARECTVHDPSGTIVRGRYCTLNAGTAAVLEMSQASGLWRVPPDRRDPVKASSFGTGEMLADAMRRGAKEVTIGLGGSATNDGGFGMARALGFRFLDKTGVELPGDSVTELQRLAHITRSAMTFPLITAAVDVRNHLLGTQGATHTYGPQKGATRQQLELLEHSLATMADVVTKEFGVDHRKVPGAGAAGGLGFGLMSFCGAHLRSGFEVVAERIKLEEAVRCSDVIITGEGKLDAQTLEGKAPAGVAKLAREEKKQVFAIVGAAEGGSELFDRVFVVGSIDNAAELVRERARELARFLSG